MTSIEPDFRPEDETAPADGSRPPPPQPTLQVGPSDRRVQRAIAFIEVVLCSGFPTQILLTPILILGGLRPFGIDGQLSLAFVVTLSLVDAAVLIVLILSFLRIHREGPRDLFLSARPIGHESMAGMFLIPVVILGVLAAFGFIEQFAPWLRNVPENPLEAMIRSRGDAWLFGTVSVVASVREEMQRAFILRRFEQLLGGAVLGLVVFSLAFGAGHLIQGWDAAVITTLLGAFWGTTYLVRRSIIAPAVSHSGFNLAEIIRYWAYV